MAFHRFDLADDLPPALHHPVTLMRAIHLSAVALLSLTSLSMAVTMLSDMVVALLFCITFAKVMIVLLIFADLRRADRSWQLAFAIYFLLLIGGLCAGSFF